MNNNAKPNSPDDALFGNSADDLADDLNNDIDVPVYRRDAQKPTDATPPAKATKIDKPGEETAGEETAEASAAGDAKPEAPERGKASGGGAKSAKTSEPAESDAAAAVTAESAPNKNTGSERASTDTSAEASAEIPGTEAPEAETPVEEKPAKRDIYAVLGRARPQRIESRPPEPEVDLSKLDASQPAGAGADVGAANGASDRWGKVDDANPAERPTTSTNDQAFIRQAKNGATPAASAGVTGAAAGAGAAGTTDGSENGNAAAGAAGAGVAGASDGSEIGGAGAAGGADTAAGAASAGVVGAGAAGSADTAVDAGVTGVDHDAVSADRDAAGAGAGAEVKRGTTSFGLFILRAVLGAYLLVRGLQTLFAFGGDPGVDVFQSQLGNYNFTDILAIGIPVAEVVAGGLLLLGLVTPFGAALATVVGGFMAFHNLDSFQGTLWPYGLSPHIQLWAALTVASISLIFLGPGRISLDRSRGWATRPLASAWIFFVVAAAATAGLWLGVGGGNPFN
ncbi:DoxX family protein [Corynebacterium evansiae]|uniref:DoxX family protein n=1 Tax=Corynebacterium evansiae TaxID=2913499 RepID=A0A9X3LMJ1_9CORY|nr:DoxX family protein [Corynebacterium evansiae]